MDNYWRLTLTIEGEPGEEYETQIRVYKGGGFMRARVIGAVVKEICTLLPQIDPVGALIEEIEGGCS